MKIFEVFLFICGAALSLIIIIGRFHNEPFAESLGVCCAFCQRNKAFRTVSGDSICRDCYLERYGTTEVGR